MVTKELRRFTLTSFKSDQTRVENVIWDSGGSVTMILHYQIPNGGPLRLHEPRGTVRYTVTVVTVVTGVTLPAIVKIAYYVGKQI